MYSQYLNICQHQSHILQFIMFLIFIGVIGGTLKESVIINLFLQYDTCTRKSHHEKQIVQFF